MPWSGVPAVITTRAHRLLSAFLWCITAGGVHQAVFGFLIAWRGRYDSRDARSLTARSTAVALPTAVSGIAHHRIRVKRWIGRYLEPLGIKVAYTGLADRPR